MHPDQCSDFYSITENGTAWRMFDTGLRICKCNQMAAKMDNGLCGMICPTNDSHSCTCKSFHRSGSRCHLPVCKYMGTFRCYNENGRHVDDKISRECSAYLNPRGFSKWEPCPCVYGRRALGTQLCICFNGYTGIACDRYSPSTTTTSWVARRYYYGTTEMPLG